MYKQKFIYSDIFYNTMGRRSWLPRKYRIIVDKCYLFNRLIINICETWKIRMCNRKLYCA